MGTLPRARFVLPQGHPKRFGGELPLKLLFIDDFGGAPSTIPVDSLRFWALGIPHPAYPATVEFDGAGLLATLEQQGWRVAIDQYRPAGGQAGHRRLTALSEQGKVVMVIDDWAFF